MLKNSLRIHIILLLLILVRVVSGQEMTGYVHSNYAGITGSFINPASILNSKLYLDINLIGLQLHVDNNYVYLAKDEYRFSRFLEKDPSFRSTFIQSRASQKAYMTITTPTSRTPIRKSG